MVKSIQKIILALCTLTLASCAQVVAPTGGEKDVNPPEILEIEPPNQSVNFSETEFEIEFDEYAVLRNLKEQLLVSPPLKYKLQSKIKGKKLIFTIDDTLKSNTTYVFNFGKSIVDLNEGNPILNFQYVLATGNTIDSLQFSGTVADAFDLKVEKEAVLLLYPSNAEDSAIAKKLPTYVSRSNEDGQFVFTNLSEGTYKLFALVDKNDNYLYDRPDEKIAFLNEPFSIPSENFNPKLYTFTLPESNQFTEKEEVFENHFKLSFKQNAENMNVQLVDTVIADFIQHVAIADKEFTLWHKQLSNQTKLILALSQNDFTDTVKFTTKSLDSASVLKLTNPVSGPQNYFESIPFLFNRPLRKINKDFISILDRDSVQRNFDVTIDSVKKNKVLLSIEGNKELEFSISMLPGSFEDVYGYTNDSISSTISFNTEEDFGNLLVKVKGNNSIHQILQLTDAKEKVLEEIFVQDTVYVFKNLNAANYGLKLINDENNNQQWDAGNYFEKKQPEKVIIYDEPITIRQNWDQEIIWIIE